ncbi:hypothetical protein V2J09_002640 [Rumex salicifolius]
MAVYYKFKSAKDYDSIPIDSHFITVANLKERIFESKHLGRGTDYDIEVTNAQTNEEYLDEAMLIPKNTSVLIRRIPGRPRMPIVTQPDESKIETKPEEDLPFKTSFTLGDVSSVKDAEPPEWDDEFGHELYAPIPEVNPVQISNAIQDDSATSKADEESKIKALIETPALDWQRQAAEGFGPGRGFGRGGRMMGGRGFGRAGPAGKPPPGYVCHRCKVPGHFIQHCPTNGDPNYDIKKVKPPTGIPKSMLMVNPDGSYALPSGAAAEMKPNEAAFEKEIEGMPSSRPVGDLPPELHCLLCTEVMKDAVLTSIRDYIMSKSVCVCGFRDILADDLLPNKTLRDTINRILESTNSSGDNAGSALLVQDMESARCPQPKMASPTQSAVSKGEHVPPAYVKETPKFEETANEERSAGPSQPLIQTSEKFKMPKVPDISEATRESGSARETASQGNTLPIEEEVQQKLAAAEAKRKKKRKPRVPANAIDMQWRNPQDYAGDGFMMPMGPSTYNPYWIGMQPGIQPGMDTYMGSYGGGMPYNMGYGAGHMGHMGPMDMPFMGVGPNDPFMTQNLMYPMVPPQRDLADFGMGYNVRPPIMTREEFEARKADLRRKREMERLGDREMPKGRDHGREGSSSVNGMPMKSKSKPVPSHREPSEDRYDHESQRDHRHRHDRGGGTTSSSRSHRMERNSPGPSRPNIDSLPHPPSKRKTEHHQPSRDTSDHHGTDRERDRDRHHHRSRRSESSSKPTEETSKKPTSSDAAATAAERKHKASVFSRISFPEGEELKNKKPKLSSEPKPTSKELPSNNGYVEEAVAAVAASASSSKGRNSNGHSHSQVDYESSDEDRHFKRKPSRYEPSPPPRQEEARRSRGPKDRERERDRDRSSRHR